MSELDRTESGLVSSKTGQVYSTGSKKMFSLCKENIFFFFSDRVRVNRFRNGSKRRLGRKHGERVLDKRTIYCCNAEEEYSENGDPSQPQCIWI